MKELRTDRRAFMLNIGPLAMICYAVILICSASVYLHHANLLQNTIMATVYSWSWLIAGIAIGLSIARYVMDAKIVIMSMLTVFMAWYFIVMG